MTWLGGAVRLTHSGLSITEWKPIAGILPPSDAIAWRELFDEYRATAHYAAQHQGISLEGFKRLFWWEWSHRFLGRLIGLVFFVPWMAFALSKRLNLLDNAKLGGIFLLGALQGWLGWYMVQSGLADAPDVSAARLAAHLGLAFIIYGFLFKMLLSSCRLLPENFQTPPLQAQSKRAVEGGLILFLTFLQILLGALAAGLDAGLIHNSWPLMGGRIVPENLSILAPLWKNIILNPVTVQFFHRLIAYVLVFLILLHLVRLPRPSLVFSSALTLTLLLFLQIALGVVLLLWQTPIMLALMHQMGGLVIWSAAIAHHHLCRRH